MNAVLAPALGPQRESDAQRRVDQAVRFGVWACTRDTFPAPAEIQHEFGVSRRTASRWRKSLALAMRDAATPRLVRPLVPAPRTRPAMVAQALLGEPAVLCLSPALLVRDIRRRFGCGERTARRAINDARRHVAVGSAPHGTAA